MTSATSPTRQANVLHILPLATIRRERLLPVSGKLVVRKGQRVNATDTVVEAGMATEHLLLDLARGLGLPAEKTGNYVQVKAGDKLSEGDVVAGPVGVTRRVVRAPKKSRVILVGEGQALLEVEGQAYGMKAGLPGLVIDLVSDRGVIIETTGALIQGVWGNGLVDFGLLRVLASAPDELLTPDRLNVSLRGAVVLGARCDTVETLKSAAELQLRGLILGSLEPSLQREAERLPVPVLLLEGFAPRPVNSVAFQLLTTNDGREVVVNAEQSDPYSGSRPEIVIPLPAQAPPVPVETATYEPDQIVRVVRAPAAGQLGTLERLAGMILFPSGVRALAGEVRLENGDSVTVPLANLEVIG